MSGANVQHWDDVGELPWREAFEMSYSDVTTELPVVPARRRTDTRTLAAVVAEMVAIDDRWYALNDGWVA